MKLEMSVENKNGVKILSAEGRIDTVTAQEFEKKLMEELRGTPSLRVDLEQVAYVSSAGLRAFLNGQKYANKEKLELVFANVCDDVMEVLEMTGFADILTIE